MPKKILKAVKHYLEGIDLNTINPQQGKGEWIPWHGDGKARTSQGPFVFHTRSILEPNGKYITKVSPKGKGEPWYVEYSSITGVSPAETVIAAMLRALEKY
jgi:hypothetical protein